MTASLGMSTGSAGIGSALVSTDVSDRARPNIEYRFLSADQVNTDLGDLMRSAITLMTEQVPSTPTTPDAFAVTYRTRSQLHDVRRAARRQRHRIHLVPEIAAVLAYLRHTGTVAQYSTIAVVDLGSSGLRVSIVDQVDGTALYSAGTEATSGKHIDAALVDHVLAELDVPYSRLQLDHELLLARSRSAKELLSQQETATIEADLLSSAPVSVDRELLAEIAAPYVRQATEFLTESLAASRSAVSDPNDPNPSLPARAPEAIALVGGGANLAALRSAIAEQYRIPLVEIADPDTAAAKGAALLAATPAVAAYPTSGGDSAGTPSSTAKVSTALLGALVVGGLVLGYGARELTPPPNPSVSPAGSDIVQTTPPDTGTEEPASTRIPTQDPIATSTDRPWWEYDPTTIDEAPLTTSPNVPNPAEPPTTTTTPSTPPPTTTPTRPSWPSHGLPPIEWPDIPTFWPSVPPGQLVPPGPDTPPDVPGEGEASDGESGASEQPGTGDPGDVDPGGTGPETAPGSGTDTPATTPDQGEPPTTTPAR
ncbi:Hsp70 family protein [Rhodococcus triatomae]|uniref:Hsp70 protein n=1 Tax=Rhodococcus triatomae TaxID=300028 RepID=A0A1G8R4X2_9NOCA|nr:Hsp70 family protein [Rhodococcus triatomae]QNG19573.1 Hsp70 family protein [Rhodococcus triatomae]QNG24512.1 Hsp70 family protein [Rhodococcus triatomae]SDJ12034.1 Hsp70 protein [Rhodococcus triatomae]